MKNVLVRIVSIGLTLVLLFVVPGCSNGKTVSNGASSAANSGASTTGVDSGNGSSSGASGRETPVADASDMIGRWEYEFKSKFDGSLCVSVLRFAENGTFDAFGAAKGTGALDFLAGTFSVSNGHISLSGEVYDVGSDQPSQSASGTLLVYTTESGNLILRGSATSEVINQYIFTDSEYIKNQDVTADATPTNPGGVSNANQEGSDTNASTSSDGNVLPDNDEDAGSHVLINTKDGLNLRKGPGTSYEIIVAIPNKKEVVIIGGSGSNSDWTYIQYGNYKGWVAKEYLAYGWGMEKPVIYLYPETPTDVMVKVDFANGAFTHTEPTPAADGAWWVKAYPDGTLIDSADGQEYPYLYWEAKAAAHYDASRGFVVKAADTESFLREKLSFMGLTSSETDEFIEYWLPRLEQNPYNLITFQGSAYEDAVHLTVTPKPDSELRIFMAYKPLDKPIQIPEQQLERFQRTGFTVVEWGGGEM